VGINEGKDGGDDGGGDDGGEGGDEGGGGTGGGELGGGIGGPTTRLAVPMADGSIPREAERASGLRAVACIDSELCASEEPASAVTIVSRVAVSPATSTAGGVIASDATPRATATVLVLMAGGSRRLLVNSVPWPGWMLCAMVKAVELWRERVRMCWVVTSTVQLVPGEQRLIASAAA